MPLLLVAITAIGVSWLAVSIHYQRKEKAAARAIEAIGGKVLSERTFLGWLLQDDSLVRVISVAVPVRLTSDDQLLWLNDLSHLQILSLGDTGITDSGLRYLEALSNLEILWLGKTDITDKGLVHLERLGRLHFLSLNDTNISDAGVVQLRRLKQLYYVDLNGTKVTSQGVDELRRGLPYCAVRR
ncbi:MAG: hypothetical protein LLG00_07045 [Planctomycetaceae bacterium]|nr:hypothetical protein [Planctomycetaceae bacterium]